MTIPPRKKTNRRGKNEGSVYQRADGKWVGQVTAGYREDNGKAIRRYVYKNNREEAAHWVAMQVAVDLHKDTARADELLLRDFLHNYLVHFKTHEVSSKTMELYYNAEKNHIVPELGAYALNDITTLQVQSFIYHLQSEKGLSQRSLSLIRGVLVQMYDYALEMKLVNTNPARNTKLPRQPKKIDDGEDKVIPIAQREAILKAAESDPIMCPIITMLMLTGMRIGEVLALQWKHIDFVTQTIHIRQALTLELEFDETGTTSKSVTVLGTPKTYTSRRSIQAPTIVFTRLREWMLYASKMKGGLDVLVPDGFVFFSTRTFGMRTYSGFRASFRHFLRRNGLPDNINLHRFRHTYASMLLEQEVHPKFAQKLLGHRDVSTTLGVYTHVVPEVFAGVTAVLDDAAQKLLDGTYQPKQTEAMTRAQLKRLDPTLDDVI